MLSTNLTGKRIHPVKTQHLANFCLYWLKNRLGLARHPILGTIILTNSCNINCKHCAVRDNLHHLMPYQKIVSEMERIYNSGVRILFLSGGESFLWKEGNHDLHTLVEQARKTGFHIICVVTNGVISANIPGADLVFLSLDGDRQTHNSIRGETFDQIMHNLEEVETPNICMYAAINKMNLGQIPYLGKLAREHPAVRCVSFNLHTPYAGTEMLTLTQEEKRGALDDIRDLIRQKYPVMNLASCFPYYLNNDWKRPGYQCMVSEDGVWFNCGRCSNIDGLCEECGYLFALEFSQILRGRPRVVWEALRTYSRFAWSASGS